MRSTAFLFILPVLVVGCAISSSPSTERGELEVRGWDSGFWEGSDPDRQPNVDLEYETVAFRRGEDGPFHRMKTELKLSYDPETGEIANAHLVSSEPGQAFRHVCLAPSGPVLHVRMSTLFDGRREDLTVVRLHDSRISMDACEEMGVGPADGLVESFDILFRTDGTYRVLPDSKAYLAGADLRVERTIRDGDGVGPETVRASYP